jgi:hypothetical protein
MNKELEQAAEEILNDYFKFDLPEPMRSEIKDVMLKMTNYANQQKWISVSERTPDLIEGKDYSENVLVVYNGRLEVMSFGYGQCEFENGEEGYGWFWANCYGDIHGDADWDDDYRPTHWQPLPQPPVIETKQG